MVKRPSGWEIASQFNVSSVAPSPHDEVERKRKPYGKGGTDHEGEA